LLAHKTALLEMVQEDPSKSDSYVLEAHPKAAGLALAGAPALVEAGPVRSTIRCRYRSEDSLLAVNVTLAARSDVIEFVVDADWHDRDKALVVRFPVRLDAPRATYERAYAVEELAANGSREPLQHWFDLSSSDFGASLLVAGIGEGYAEGDALRMTLLRATRDMNARMDEGAHHLRYALYPHAGTWRQAMTPRHAEEFNAAFVAMQEAHHEGRLTGWGERRMPALPREYSFLSTAPANVIATAVKISQAPWESDALMVRVYEASGKATKAELKIGFDVWSAEEVNLVEEPTGNKLDCTNNTLHFDLGAGKLKTFRLIVSARGGLRDVPATDTGGENEGGSAKGQRKTGM
jgi:alpha-mannosidase